MNVWLAMRDDAHALIKTRLTWDDSQGEYSGPITDRQAKFFRLMSDRSVVQRLFRVDGLTNDWTLWSIYFDSKRVGAEITKLATDFSTRIKIVGAWHWDGRQAGTQFVYEDVTRDVDIDDPDVDPPMIDDPNNDEWNTYPQIIDPDFDWPQITIQVTSNEITGTSGTPRYPLHSRVIQFMPDIVTYAVAVEVSITRPTTISDIHLLTSTNTMPQPRSN